MLASFLSQVLTLREIVVVSKILILQFLRTLEIVVHHIRETFFEDNSYIYTRTRTYTYIYKM